MKGSPIQIFVDGAETTLIPEGGTSDGDVLLAIEGALTPKQLVQVAGWLWRNHPDLWGVAATMDDHMALVEAWRDDGTVQEANEDEDEDI